MYCYTYTYLLPIITAEGSIGFTFILETSCGDSFRLVWIVFTTSQKLHSQLNSRKLAIFNQYDISTLGDSRMFHVLRLFFFRRSMTSSTMSWRYVCSHIIHYFFLADKIWLANELELP